MPSRRHCWWPSSRPRTTDRRARPARRHVPAPRQLPASGQFALAFRGHRTQYLAASASAGGDAAGALPGSGSVDVSRLGPDGNGSYKWARDVHHAAGRRAGTDGGRGGAGGHQPVCAHRGDGEGRARLRLLASCTARLAALLRARARAASRARPAACARSAAAQSAAIFTTPAFALPMPPHSRGAPERDRRGRADPERGGHLRAGEAGAAALRRLRVRDHGGRHRAAAAAGQPRRGRGRQAAAGGVCEPGALPGRPAGAGGGRGGAAGHTRSCAPRTTAAMATPARPCRRCQARWRCASGAATPPCRWRWMRTRPPSRPR
jgi:hypothetical protein